MQSPLNCCLLILPLPKMTEARIKYTPENLQLAFITHTGKVFPVRGRILLFSGILLIWTGLILLLINLTQSVKPGFVFYIIAGLVFIIVHYYITRNLGRQAFNKLKDRAAIEYHLSFDENGFRIKARETAQEYQWKQVEKAVVNNKLIMLYVTKHTFYFLLPENISTGDFGQLGELVKQNVAKILK